MPTYDLGLLITLNIALTIAGILAATIGLITMSLMLGRQLGELSQETREGMREIAQMSREVAFMIRRQYGDIDRDLQEIKDLLGGQ